MAQAHADAVFLGEQLAPVLDAVRVGRRARHLMQQNLVLCRDLQRDRGADRDRGLRHSADRGGHHVRIVDPGHGQRVARTPRARGSHASPSAFPSDRRAGGAVAMNVLIYLVPMALLLGLTGLAASFGRCEAASMTTWRERRSIYLDNDDLRGAP